MWAQLHGLTSYVVLWMRAETGPLGTVELSHHAGRYIRRIWVSAREMRARPPTAPLGLICTLGATTQNGDIEPRPNSRYS